MIISANKLLKTNVCILKGKHNKDNLTDERLFSFEKLSFLDI